MPPKAAPLTHFLCIPLSSPQLARSLASFREDVTSPLSFGIPEDAVRPLGTMHLTLGVMTLRADDESSEGGATVKRAVEVLKSVNAQEALNRPKQMVSHLTGGKLEAGSSSNRESLKISLKGLESMTAPSKTSVLYAPPSDPEGVLYRFCSHIRKTFQEEGVMPVEERPLLLHATVVNTIYVKGKGKVRGRGRMERLLLDAREVMARYEDYDWMTDVPVRALAICRRGAKKVGEDGDEAYEVEAKIEF